MAIAEKVGHSENLELSLPRLLRALQTKVRNRAKSKKYRERTVHNDQYMSALPLITDIVRMSRHVGFVPEPDIRAAPNVDVCHSRGLQLG